MDFVRPAPAGLLGPLVLSDFSLTSPVAKALPSLAWLTPRTSRDPDLHCLKFAFVLPLLCYAMFVPVSLFCSIGLHLPGSTPLAPAMWLLLPGLASPLRPARPLAQLVKDGTVMAVHFP